MKSYELLPLAILACASLTGCGGDKKQPVDAPPAMAAQSFTTPEDTALAGRLIASDDGGSLVFTVQTNPMSGTLSAISAAGDFTYQPGANFNGADTFTVSVADSALKTTVAIMTLNVTPVNDAPVANADVLTLTSADSIDVVANDTDPDNDPLAVTLVGASFPAGATVGASQRISVPAPAGFKGLVRFQYRVTDSGGLSSTATAIGFVNVPPVKAVFAGRPPGAAPAADRLYLDNFLASRAADGGATSRIVSMNISRNGRSLVYQQEIPAGATPTHNELFHVDLTQPDQRHVVTGPLGAGFVASRIVQTDDGRQVVLEIDDAGAASSIYRYDTQSAATLAQRISPPDAELRYTSAPWLNAAGTFVYYGGRAPMNGASAAYRTSLSTGATSRIAPLASGALGVGVDFVRAKPDESVLVVHRLEDGPVGDPHNTVQINSPNTPDTSQLIHIPAPAAMSFEMPLLAPDGLYTVLFGSSRLTLARTDTPMTETAIGSNTFAWQYQYNVPDRDRIMRADSQAALLVSGCGSPVQFPGVPCDIFELTFADPATPVRVNLANAADTNSSDAAYSADGARILFVQTAAGGIRSLAVVRRGAFGTQQVVSANAAESVTSYSLDASGYVVLYRADVPGQADDKLYIANVDAPGEALEIGAASDAGPFALAAR